MLKKGGGEGDKVYVWRGGLWGFVDFKWSLLYWGVSHWPNRSPLWKHDGSLGLRESHRGLY